VEVRPADVSLSAVDSSLEPCPGSRQRLAVRLGLRLVGGLSAEAAQRIAAARAEAPFADAQDLALRARLEQREMQQLAAADALQSLAGHRRQQVWQATAWQRLPPLLREAGAHEVESEAQLALEAAPEGEEVRWDYAATGLSLRRHPLALLRPQLAERGLKSSAELADWRSGRSARSCGIVTVRQRPQTAKGTIFVSLEDEHGSVQVIVWADVYAKYRSTIISARLLAVQGRWQKQNGVAHLLAQHFEDLSPLLGAIFTPSRDFH